MLNEEIAQKIESCVIASAWIKASTHVTDNKEIYKLENAESPFEFLNGIYRTRFQSPKEADKKILEHFETFRTQKIAFRWYSFPHSLPSDLNNKLKALGPTRITEMAGLFASVDDFAMKQPMDTTVEELSETNLEDYCHANTEGWGQTGISAEKIKADIGRDFEKSNMGYRAFLARYKGEPASTAMLRIVDDAGYFFGGSTSPRFRQKGVYSALVWHRIQLLKKLGVPTALVFAQKSTSAPICLKLGFKLGCECVSYSFSFD